MTEFLIKNIITEILFENKICEFLEDRWIVNYLYDNLLCEKLLYGQPLTISELRALLRQKILHFEFIKLDGEVRDVPRGTLLMKYVPQSQHPKGIRPSSPKVATFYDLEKRDWRSVSQRSKEIVLKKDEETGKPVIMVKDKPESGDIGVGDQGIEKKELDVTKEKPIEQPGLSIDDQPVDITTKEPVAQVKKVKPVESTENTKTFYLVNPVTGASRQIETTPKEIVKELKKMGKNWQLTDEKNYKESDEIIKAANEKEPDIINLNDKRNYLNNRGKNVEIEIVGEDPYGGFYARTLRGGMFKIPANKMKNIGGIIRGKKEDELKTKSDTESIINKMGKRFDLDNLPANEI